MHDGIPQTVEVLSRLIPKLQTQGYEFVTIDEMIRRTPRPFASTARAGRGALPALGAQPPPQPPHAEETVNSSRRLIAVVCVTVLLTFSITTWLLREIPRLAPKPPAPPPTATTRPDQRSRPVLEARENRGR